MQYEQKVTNNTMEMKAGIESLKGDLEAMKKNLEDVSSSCSSSSSGTSRRVAKLPVDLSVSFNEV